MLVAGVDKDARASVEATVRQAFAGRDPEGPWSVSLVRLGSSWSVTLSGPGDRFRHVSFVAEQHRLEEAIREVISGEAPRPAVAARPSSGPSVVATARGRIQDRHVCEKCRKELRVSYEGQPD